MTDPAEKTMILNRRLQEARATVPIRSTWKHSKGGIYRVVGHTIDSDDGMVRIRYRRIGGPDFGAFYEADIEFVRPIHEWKEHRFTPISSEVRSWA